MPYTGSRNVPELSRGPDHVESGGLTDLIGELPETATIRLTPQEDRDEYGEWHRMGLACGHLADRVAGATRQGRFVIGLLGNCTSLLGMLAGLQRSDPGHVPRRVGMLFIDAHADFNTPETTLSGMLGGMPVAIAAGLCLARLRRESRLEPAVPTASIVMAGLRDVDPAEQQLLDESEVECLAVDDLRPGSPRLGEQMTRLASRTDAVYVHIDMDVLDPAEVGGHPLTVPGGPSSEDLAAALGDVFACEKSAALGIASTPPADRDEGGTARRAAHRLIRAAVAAAGKRARRV